MNCSFFSESKHILKNTNLTKANKAIKQSYTTNYVSKLQTSFSMTGIDNMATKCARKLAK